MPPTPEHGPSITERAAALAQQAAEAAAPLIEQAAEAAAPVIEQARVRTQQVVTAAAPLVDQARERAAQGVGLVAENLDRLSGGRYRGQIETVTGRVRDVLDGGPTLPRDTPAPDGD